DAGRDHHVANVFQRTVLPEWPHEESSSIARYLPGRQGKVVGAQPRCKCVQIDVVRGHAIADEVDADFRRLDAAEINTRNTVNAFERALQVAVEEIVGVLQVACRGNAQPQDRLVRGHELEDVDALQVVGQVVSYRIDLVAHLDAFHANVGTPAEEHENARGVARRGRSQLLDAAHGR